MVSRGRSSKARTWGRKEYTEIRVTVFDWDGTITGIPLSTVVKDRPFFTSSLSSSRPHWGNMSVCPHRYSEAGGQIYVEWSLFWEGPHKLSF